MGGPGRFEAGEMVGSRYRVREYVASGSMGVVYRAEDVTTGDEVAVKLLNSHYAEVPEVATIFRREASIARELQHDNCVGVRDFGTLDTGALFMVMEFYQGELLRSRLVREQRLPLARALHIVRHVLSALGHAHAASVVHRDVKPDNIILVAREGDDEFAKLLDFGIAKRIADAAQNDEFSFTAEGNAVGTPHYIAPEQAFGESIDGRADLYSVTAMLFELVTGEPPYQASRPVDVLAKHLYSEIPTLASVAPELTFPPELEAVIQRGLAKKPEERFQSAAEYLDAL